MRAFEVVIILAFLALKARGQCLSDAEPLLWSSTETWPSDGIPGRVPLADDNVTITVPVILDTVTPALSVVEIHDGGCLMFGCEAAEAEIKLTADYILVGDGGHFGIGSSDSPCLGKAEVVLKGCQTDSPSVDGFGQNFIGVEGNGSLGIYGKPAVLSWTRLAESAGPPAVSWDEKRGDRPGGIVVYIFNSTGDWICSSKVKPKILVQNSNSDPNPNPCFEAATEDSIVVIANRPGSNKVNWAFNNDQNMDNLETVIEGFLGGSLENFQSQWNDRDKSFLFISDRAQSNGIITQYLDPEDVQDDTVHKLTACLGGRNFTVERTKLHQEPIAWKLEVSVLENCNSQINVIDDPSTWNANDQIVIASSDRDMEHAEVFEISSVEEKTITLKGYLRHTHLGINYHGVEMRAEVGLLTRNVKIHGDISNDCQRDNFGGQTKALNNSRAYNIQGAEFYHMGQEFGLGQYPIHCHLCDDTVRPILKQNSIHHTFNRAITIHGTHNSTIEDNVAYDTIGHTFFLEDGCEKDNTFNHNFGCVTRQGNLTLSDNRSSTFWITSPLTTFTNNAAGGTEKRGIGIWYLFPDEPVGPCKQFGFFQDKEAKHTPIAPFENNTAHTNYVGFGFFNRLGENHDIIGCSTYNALEDPKKKPKDTNLVPIEFWNFTGYNNRAANARIRATTVEVHGFHSVGSKQGLKFVRNMVHGYQLLQDAIIVGNSPNVGDNFEANETSGILLNAEGPMHLKNVDFKGFNENECNIKFADKFRFLMGVHSTVQGLSFDGGIRICNGNGQGNGSNTVHFRDLDGSLIGEPQGQSVIHYNQTFIIDDQCSSNSEWNLAVCPPTVQFGAVLMLPKSEQPGETFITSEGELAGMNGLKLISYFCNDHDNNVIHFSDEAKNFTLRFTGLDQHKSCVIGVCLPMDVANNGLMDDLLKNQNYNEVSGLDQLDTPLTGDKTFNVYFDRTSSVMHFNITEKAARVDGNLGDCNVGLKVDKSCPSIKVNIGNLDSAILADGDCRDRM